MGNFEWMAALHAGAAVAVLRAVLHPLQGGHAARLPRKTLLPRVPRLAGVVSMVAAIVFHIAFPLSSGWIVLHGVFGIEKWTCILMICGLTAVYTVLGGLAAVVMTETIQAIVLIVGAVVDHGLRLREGRRLGRDGPRPATRLDEIGPAFDAALAGRSKKSFPGSPSFWAIPCMGIWYWCADQTIVQRVLGAKDENHARIGPLFCALIKILPVFIFVLPGLMFYVIVRDGALPGVTVEQQQGSLRPDDQEPAADGPVRRDGGGLDGGPDGQPGQRGQLDLDAVQLRSVEAIPARHARAPPGDHRPHGGVSCRSWWASPWCRCWTCTRASSRRSTT